MNFEFTNTTRIIAGKDSASKLGYEICFHNCKRPLIMSDKIVWALSEKTILNTIEDAKIKVGAIFCDIPTDSSSKTISDIADLYNKNECDCLLAVGGGSVIDTAKGVRLVLSQNCNNIEDLQGNECVKKGIEIPFFVIPTTCGTGSECTGVAVIKNQKGEKIEYISSFLLPNATILDSNFITSLPPHLIAGTAFDALSHAVESIISAQANPISTSFALSAIKLIFENIIDAVKKSNSKNSLNLLIASNLAGIAFSNSMVGVCHAIAHTLGSVCHISHANSIAILLKECLAYNFESCKNEYANIYRYVFKNDNNSTDDTAKLFIQKVDELGQNLRQLCGLKNQLNDYDVSDENIEKISRLSLNDGAIVTNKISVTTSDIKSIIDKCKKI